MFQKGFQAANRDNSHTTGKIIRELQKKNDSPKKALKDVNFLLHTDKTESEEKEMLKMI